MLLIYNTADPVLKANLIQLTGNRSFQITRQVKDFFGKGYDYT